MFPQRQLVSGGDNSIPVTPDNQHTIASDPWFVHQRTVDPPEGPHVRNGYAKRLRLQTLGAALAVMP